MAPREIGMLRTILTAFVCFVVAPVAALGADFGGDPGDYAVYAGGNGSLGDRADVTGRVGIGGNISLGVGAHVRGDLLSGGHVWSSDRVIVDGWVLGGADTYIRTDNTVGGTVQSANRLYLSDRAHVTGDLIAGNLISVSASAVVGGVSDDYAAMAHTWTEPTLAFPAFSPGRRNNWPGAGKTLELAPGDYRDMSAANGCTIRLRSGTYQFNNLWVNQNVDFEIDDSAGPVEVRVARSMSIGNGTEFTVSSGAIDGFALWVNGALSCGEGVTMTGRLHATGDISVGNRFTLSGSIYTERNFWSQTDLTITAESAPPVYYVSTRGSDANAGTSADAPLRTIQHAVSMCTVPGSTIHVAPGTYTETVTIGAGAGADAVSGERADPTRIIGDVNADLFDANPGDVVIDGRNANADGIVIDGVSHWSIEHVDIRNTRDYGVRLTSGGVSISDARIEVPSEFAVFLESTGDVAIEDCVFTRAEGTGHGIWVWAGAGDEDVGISVQRNRLHTDGDRCLDSWYRLGPAAEERYDASSTQHAIVVAAMSADVARVTIANNIITDSSLAIRYQSDRGNAEVTIANNTILASQYSIYTLDTRKPVTIVNNMIVDCYYGLIAANNAVVRSHLESEITMDMSGIKRPYLADGAMVTESPRFLDPSAGDFSLAWGSPGLDQGQRVDVAATDIAGTARPLDGDDDEEFLYDLGAYESDPERDRVRYVRWREVSGDRSIVEP